MTDAKLEQNPKLGVRRGKMASLDFEDYVLLFGYLGDCIQKENKVSEIGRNIALVQLNSGCI